MASEQGLKRKATSGLQSLPKKGRMSNMTSMTVLRQAQPVMTVRERALTQEKERQRLKAEKEERKKYFRDLQSEATYKIERAEREKEDSKKISGWIERIPECPVFRPTEEEFKDPLKYIKGVEDKVAAKYGICKIIPPYVDDVFSGRSKFKDVDFTMEVRKQPLKMVDWDKKENTLKGVDFNKDKKTWTFRDLEKFANEFVEKNYEGSSSQLQYRFIEREFWKEFLLRQNKYVRYASDVPGTAFDAWEELARSNWNLGKLPRLDDSVLRNVGIEIPGVTIPMLYVGMLFSMFAWHVEDQYLYSINYHHLGAPKTWYGVPGCAARDFERVAAEKVFNLPLTEEGRARTLRLLIGKTIMFPPGLLVEVAVPVCRAVQQPGEYVVTFPRSYHAGYSNGFNCGEAVNFAMPDWFPYGVACARRYRLLQQVQVVAHDELLCKEAQHLQTRMKGESGAPPYQLTQMDVHTAVEFVRLMRWQHRERWKLQQRRAVARALDRLAGSTSMVCSVCHHKNYFGYVLCECTAGLPICFNHPDVLRACACQSQPSANGGWDPARTVMYLPELPLLEMTARDFETHPEIREGVAAATEAELVNPELKDEWQLGKQREESMGAFQPAVEERGIDMSKYVEWAPIQGYNYDDVLQLKTIQPGTPLQQRGEALAGASRENSQEGSPNPGPLLLTDSPANEDQLLTAVNEALPSAVLQAPAQHALSPAHPKTLASAARDESPDAPADSGAVGQVLPNDLARSASKLFAGGDSQETPVLVESGDSGVGQEKQGGGTGKRKVREGMGGAPMDGRNAAGGAGPGSAAESMGGAVWVGSEKGESGGVLGKAKKRKGARSASEKRSRKIVPDSSDDSGELQEAEPHDQVAEGVSKGGLEMLAPLGGAPAEPGNGVLAGSRQTEEEQGAGSEKAQEADDAQAEERQQEAPGGSAAVRFLEADRGWVPKNELAAVSTLKVGAVSGPSEANYGKASGQPRGAVQMEGEGRAGGETLPQPESQWGRGAAVELDDDEKKQPGKDADENGVSQEEIPGMSVVTEGGGRGETDSPDGVADAPDAEEMTSDLGGGGDEEAIGQTKVLAAALPTSGRDARKSVTTKVAGADRRGLDKSEPESESGKGPEKGAAASQGGLQAAERDAYGAGRSRPSVQGASADPEAVRGREDMRDMAAPPVFSVPSQHPEEGRVVTAGKQNLLKQTFEFFCRRWPRPDVKVPDGGHQELVEQRVGPGNEVGLGSPALGGGHGLAQRVRGFPLLEQRIPGGDIVRDGSVLRNVNAMPQALMRKGNSENPAEGAMGSSVAVEAEEGLPSRTEVQEWMEAVMNADARRRGALGGSVGASAEEERAPLGVPAGRVEVLGAARESQEGVQGKMQRAARKSRLVRDRQQRSQVTAATGGEKLLQRGGGHAGKEDQSSTSPVAGMRGRVEPSPGESRRGVTAAATPSKQNMGVEVRRKSSTAQGRSFKAAPRQGRVEQSGDLNLEPKHPHLKIGLGAQPMPPKGHGFDLNSQPSAQMA